MYWVGEGLPAQISRSLCSIPYQGAASPHNKDLLGRSEKRENNLLNFMDCFKKL